VDGKNAALKPLCFSTRHSSTGGKVGQSVCRSPLRPYSGNETTCAPTRSSCTICTELVSRPPSLRNAADIASPTFSPVARFATTATIVGPAPLIVQPNAPAAPAAALTAANPGISGPRAPSTTVSSPNALPRRATSPRRMPATCTTVNLQCRYCFCELGTSFARLAWLALAQSRPLPCTSAAQVAVHPLHLLLGLPIVTSKGVNVPSPYTTTVP
jgi:hypothetical protein